MSEPTHDCPGNNRGWNATERVVHYEGAWRFDCDDGLLGHEIKFCPFCGLKLPEATAK